MCKGYGGEMKYTFLNVKIVLSWGMSNSSNLSRAMGPQSNIKQKGFCSVCLCGTLLLTPWMKKEEEKKKEKDC